jgi:hypothetical protein
VCSWGGALEATRPIKASDLLLQKASYSCSGRLVRPKVKILYRLVDDPVGHGIDIKANDITSNPIRFNERRPSPHEGVGNPDPLQIMGLEEGLPQGAGNEFRKKQGSE